MLNSRLHILFPNKTILRYQKDDKNITGIYKYDGGIFGDDHMIVSNTDKKALSFSEGKAYKGVNGKENAFVMVWGRDAKYITVVKEESEEAPSSGETSNMPKRIPDIGPNDKHSALVMKLLVMAANYKADKMLSMQK